MKRLVLSLIALLTLSAAAAAQAPAEREYRFKVRHDHIRKYCRGELVISGSGVEYVTEEKGHSRKWQYVDVQMLKLVSPAKLKVLSYEASAKKLGGDRDFSFELVEGELTKEVSDFVLSKVKRPVSTSFVPGREDDPVYSIPVRHRRRFGGHEGTLKAYAGGVAFEAEGGNEHSRFWRWSDIQGVGRSGRFRLSVTTYEPEFGGPTKSFDFDLKEALTDETYDYVWERVYRVSARLPSAAGVKTLARAAGQGQHAHRKEMGGEVTVVGYVSDSACGLRHHDGMDETDCVLACAKGGRFVLADRENGKVYELDDAARGAARELANKKVRVTGHLAGKGIHVMKIEPVS